SQARGATADSPLVVGWSGPAGAVGPESPAAIPDTCVPWNDEAGSTASRPGSPAFGPGKTFATITFGVVHFVPPFGKPAGYEKPAGLKNALFWSTPSSTTPILTPVPSAPRTRWRTSAPITPGLRFVESV